MGQNGNVPLDLSYYCTRNGKLCWVWIIHHGRHGLLSIPHSLNCLTFMFSLPILKQLWVLIHHSLQYHEPNSLGTLTLPSRSWVFSGKTSRSPVWDHWVVHSSCTPWWSQTLSSQIYLLCCVVFNSNVSIFISTFQFFSLPLGGLKPTGLGEQRPPHSLKSPGFQVNANG